MQFGLNKFLAQLSGIRSWSFGNSVIDLSICNLVLTSFLLGCEGLDHSPLVTVSMICLYAIWS